MNTRPFEELVLKRFYETGFAFGVNPLIGSNDHAKREHRPTPETKLTAMCERTIQQLDELSEKLDAYCRELESRAETPAETPVEM